MMRDDWRALVRRVEGLTALADGVWQELDPGNRLGLQDGDPNAQACLCWLIYHVAEMTIPFLQTVSGSTAASVWVKANSRQIVGNLKTLSTNLFHHIFDSIPPGFQPPFTRDACIAFTDAQIDVMGSMGISKFEGHLRELQGKARQIYVSVHGTDDIAAFNLPPEFFHLTNAIWSLYQRVQGASGVAFATGGVQQVASSTGSVQVISTTRTSYSVPPVVVPVYQPIAQPSGFTQPPVFSQDPAATRIGPSDFRFPPGQGTTVPGPSQQTSGPSQRTAGTDAATNKIAAAAKAAAARQAVAAAAKQAPAVPKPPPAATAPKPPPAATAPKPPSVAAAAKAVVAKQAPAAPKPSAAASAKPAPAPKPSAAASAKPAPKPSAAASAKPAPKPAAAKAVKPAPKPAAAKPAKH